MKKVWKSILGLTLILAVGITVLTGCGSSNGGTEAKKIAIVCDQAGQNDNGYNQAAVEGAKQVATDFGFEYKVVEPTNGVPAALETLAQDGYNIIFNLEYDFDALIKGVGGAKPIAEQYPNTTFVCFNDNPNVNDDGSLRHKNVISVLFDVHQASFLAGALSVETIENAELLFGNGYNFTDPENGGRSIGFIGGTNSNGITVFSYGFLEGIDYAAKELGVNYDYYTKYDAGFVDPALGSTVAGTYYDKGANIVYGVAGSVGDGITSKAKEVQKLAIQVDANKDTQQPGYVLTSVLKNTNVPVYTISKALHEGTLSSMENVQAYSLSSGATGITDLAEISKYIVKSDEAQAKWKEIQDKIQVISDKIASGEIKVTNATIGETFDATAHQNVTVK